MSMTLIVRKQQEGSNLTLNLSITTYVITETVSDQFEIADLAWLRLKCKPDGLSHAIYISHKKHELSKTSVIRMNVTSEALNFSKEFYCPSEDWSEWVCLGLNDTVRLSVNGSYVFSSIADAFICASKVTTETTNEVNCNLCPKLYEDQDFTDFKLTAADGSVAVHKACLAANSDYFKGMFSGKWKETDEGSVEFKGVSRKNLQDIKDFIYLGKLPDDGLSSLIVLAKRFLMENLVVACAKKIAVTVVPENLYSLNELACQNNIPELTSAMMELTVCEVFQKALQLKIKRKDEDTALKEADKK